MTDYLEIEKKSNFEKFKYVIFDENNIFSKFSSFWLPVLGIS